MARRGAAVGETGQHERLLGALLQHGIVRGQPEVIATRAVVLLLEGRRVAQRLTRWLAQRGGVALADELAYRAESGVAGGGRVDIAASDDTGLQVVLEAKFGAPLGADQLLAYARALDGPLLGVLVPDHRRPQAAAALHAVEAELASMGVTGVVLTWDELMEALETAGADAGDVAQLRSLCAAAGGMDIGHFDRHALEEGRHARLDDLHAICDRVTSRLHLELAGGRVFPFQTRDGDFTGFRYVCPQRGAYCFAIGVRSWESAREAPIWMRWHRDTGEVSAAQLDERLANAGFTSRRDDGHVWVPLKVEPATDAPSIIDDLAAQALRLDAIARGLQENGRG